MFKPTLNIEFIPTYDSRVLLVSDASVWLHLEEEQTFLGITTPGRTNRLVVPFTKGKITSLNSNNLELTCAESEAGLISLPDGVYKFDLFVCDGDKFSESFYYLRTVNLQTRLDNFLIKQTINNCDDNTACIDKYFKMQLLIDAAHAHVREGNVKRAAYHYQEVLEMMDELENCGCYGK